MEPPGLHRVECKPIRKERFPTVIFPRGDQFLGIPPLFWRRSWHFDIESTVLIAAHYSQPLEPILNLNQPFKHIATNDNLPLAAFSQRLQMRGIQADLLCQIGKELSIYNLSFVYFCMSIKFQ